MSGADTRAPAPDLRLSRTYSIAGIPCVLSGSAAALDRVDLSYGAFRAELAGGGEALTLKLGDDEPLLEAVGGFVEGVLACLAAQGTYAIHAASLVDRGGALIISGKSGSGKTTLALGLLRRGLRLLSDEIALSAPDARTILPYHRALHVRPGTAELIDELAYLNGQPRRSLATDKAWPLLPDELAEIFPGSLGEAAPLRHVVLLGARSEERAQIVPLSTAIAAVELLAATPAAAVDFGAALARLVALLEGTRCARLDPGPLEESLDLLTAWLDQNDG